MFRETALLIVMSGTLLLPLSHTKASGPLASGSKALAPGQR